MSWKAIHLQCHFDADRLLIQIIVTALHCYLEVVFWNCSRKNDIEYRSTFPCSLLVHHFMNLFLKHKILSHHILLT